MHRQTYIIVGFMIQCFWVHKSLETYCFPLLLLLAWLGFNFMPDEKEGVNDEK